MTADNRFWNGVYQNGQENRYPWDYIVSFVYNFKPNMEASKTNVLELGCGTACNLWFCAREGFNVCGLDYSSHAIQKCEERFQAENLIGEFRCGDFTNIPWADSIFHLVLDRGSLTCASFPDITKAFNDIFRVLKPGGRFIFSPYARIHTSALSGVYNDETRLVSNIDAGSLQGIEQICFFDEQQIEELVSKKWNVLDIELLTKEKLHENMKSIHAEYHVVLEKPY